MSRCITTVTTFVLSSLGWYAGDFLGTFSAFTLAMVGTGVGLYLGRQLAERWGA